MKIHLIHVHFVFSNMNIIYSGMFSLTIWVNFKMLTMHLNI